MNLVDRAKNIITSPKTEWPAIAEETPDVGTIVTGYVLPLAGLSAAASFIGYAFIVSYASITFGIMYALLNLVLTIASVLATAFVVDLLAPSFGSEKDFGRSLQLVAFSFTPSWIGGLLNIIPVIGWLGSPAGLYGIYLMYLGMPVVKKTPQDKVVVYMIVSAIVLIAVYGVLSMILGGIFLTLFGLGALSVMG